MMSGVLPRLAIVVFAAGLSTRLGAPKALVRVRGVSLLVRTLRVLAPLAISAPVRVVIPARAPRYRIGIGPTASFIPNPRRAAGLATSVVLGLRQSRHDAAALLLPVDLAQLESRDLERLATRWRGARRRVVAHRIVTGPTHADRGAGAAAGMAGTPLILPRRLFREAVQVTGDRGLRDWLRGLPVQEVNMVPMVSADLDVDTPRDLAEARRRPQIGGLRTGRRPAHRG
jgi:CTP:molybdopterin cytidylyltransferase MocA